MYTQEHISFECALFVHVPLSVSVLSIMNSKLFFFDLKFNILFCRVFCYKLSCFTIIKINILIVTFKFTQQIMLSFLFIFYFPKKFAVFFVPTTFLIHLTKISYLNAVVYKIIFIVIYFTYVIIIII